MTRVREIRFGIGESRMSTTSGDEPVPTIRHTVDLRLELEKTDTGAALLLLADDLEDISFHELALIPAMGPLLHVCKKLSSVHRRASVIGGIKGAEHDAFRGVIQQVGIGAN